MLAHRERRVAFRLTGDGGGGDPGDPDTVVEAWVFSESFILYRRANGSTWVYYEPAGIEFDGKTMSGFISTDDGFEAPLGLDGFGNRIYRGQDFIINEEGQWVETYWVVTRDQSNNLISKEQSGQAIRGVQVSGYVLDAIVNFNGQVLEMRRNLVAWPSGQSSPTFDAPFAEVNVNLGLTGQLFMRSRGASPFGLNYSAGVVGFIVNNVLHEYGINDQPFFTILRTGDGDFSPLRTGRIRRLLGQMPSLDVGNHFRIYRPDGSEDADGIVALSLLS